jgi:hypothetical protein
MQHLVKADAQGHVGVEMPDASKQALDRVCDQRVAARLRAGQSPRIAAQIGRLADNLFGHLGAPFLPGRPIGVHGPLSVARNTRRILETRYPAQGSRPALLPQRRAAVLSTSS